MPNTNFNTNGTLDRMAAYTIDLGMNFFCYSLYPYPVRVRVLTLMTGFCAGAQLSKTKKHVLVLTERRDLEN